jgi:hypothetical protein
MINSNREVFMEVHRFSLKVFIIAMFAAYLLAGKVEASNLTTLRASEEWSVDHDVSPPLRDMRPLPPHPGPQEEIRWRPIPHRPVVSPLGDSVVQTSEGPLLSTVISVLNFDGVSDASQGAVSGYLVAPPDTNGAVGATQYVQWVNLAFAVFNKTTQARVYGPAAGNTLWSGFNGGNGACANNNSGDIIAQYDKAANRWIMMQPVFTSPYYICVAVSTTSDATGSYYRYAFAVPNQLFPDYPKLGVWPDGYYLSYNQFQGNTFVGPAACALERGNMLTGNAATMQCFDPGAGYGSLLPSDLDGSVAPPVGSPDYFLSYDLNGGSLDLWEFHVDFATPGNSTFTGPTVIPVAPFSEACGGGTCIPQLGTRQKLDSLGDRLMYRLAYRNLGDHESLAVNHSVNTGSGNTGIRWYELRTSGPLSSPCLSYPCVYQQGTYAPDSNFRWMGSIAMDKAGNMALGYSVSSSGMNPAVRYTGRVPADPLGTMESETSIIEGTGSQTRNLNRWGDYSSMSIDPVDDCTFWYTNEYLKTNGTFNWNTRIASFKFASCTGSQDFSISATPSTQTVVQGTNANYQVDVTALNGFSGTVTFSVTGVPGGNASFNPTGITGSGTSTLTVFTNVLTPGTYTLTVTGTSGSLIHSTTVTLVVNSTTPPDFSVSAAPSTETVKRPQKASYAVTVTALNGFNGTVNLSVSGLPASSSASFNPSSITGPGTSTLKVNTNKKTAAGTFTLTITGTSGGLTHSAQVTLVVQ